ncbi:TPA: hypothetical protein OTQ96_003745 [Klebsiella pneumoniae]|nr:hypothetical protein [Klebsiella pneumoniae]
MGEYFRVTVQVLLDILLTCRSAKRQQALDKVNALNKVLIDNKIYLTECSDGRDRCALTERNLSTEWSRVGDLIQNDSPDLAAFCRNKSDYWVNPKGHSREKVEQLGITIKMLERQIEHLKANML